MENFNEFMARCVDNGTYAQRVTMSNSQSFHECSKIKYMGLCDIVSDNYLLVIMKYCALQYCYYFYNSRFCHTVNAEMYKSIFPEKKVIFLDDFFFKQNEW